MSGAPAGDSFRSLFPRARARVRQFSFFAFTSSPNPRNTLCHSAIRVKTLGENRDFSSEIGGPSAYNALIFNRFAFTSEKNHIHTPFLGVEIGERAPRAGEYAGSTKDHTHIRLSFSYLINTNVYLTYHDALRFFRSSNRPFHRTALRKTRQRRQARGVKVKTQKS